MSTFWEENIDIVCFTMLSIWRTSFNLQFTLKTETSAWKRIAFEYFSQKITRKTEKLNANLLWIFAHREIDLFSIKPICPRWIFSEKEAQRKVKCHNYSTWKIIQVTKNHKSVCFWWQQLKKDIPTEEKQQSFQFLINLHKLIPQPHRKIFHFSVIIFGILINLFICWW